MRLGYHGGLCWRVMDGGKFDPPISLFPWWNDGFWNLLLITFLSYRHLMTGVGAYFYIVWGIWLRYCLSGRQDDVELVWPRFVTSFPQVIVKSPQSSMNGESKKQK
jgi:hypothetical protein